MKLLVSTLVLSLSLSAFADHTEHKKNNCDQEESNLSDEEQLAVLRVREKVLIDRIASHQGNNREQIENQQREQERQAQIEAQRQAQIEAQRQAQIEAQRQEDLRRDREQREARAEAQRRDEKRRRQALLQGYPRQTFDIHGQGYYPDQYTADAVCRSKDEKFLEAISFTPYRQAGGTIEGKRSVDGSPAFRTEKWFTGQAIESVVCVVRPVPVTFDVPGSYYPDQNTANGLCVLNNKLRAIGFIPFRQAGNWIEGKISTDGSAAFTPKTWAGGQALQKITCE